MKKVLSILSFAFIAATSVKAQGEPKVEAASGPHMTFVTETIDYGDIAKGSDGNRKFKFSNTGSGKLTITNAQGSCGCTVPTLTKKEFEEKEEGTIDVKYDTNREGPFTKYVTLTTNAPGQETLRLMIKGNVIKEPDAVPAKTNSLSPAADH